VAARFLILAVVLCGCAETMSPDALPPMQANAQMYPPVDTFWLQQEVAAMREPKPLPVRSISLGYIGDAPLSGGVMRDTREVGPNRAVYIEQQQQPCACALRPE
jgi:hypothetical protein